MAEEKETEESGARAWAGSFPGWFDILDRLWTDLVAMGWDREVCDLKDKFGTLSFTIFDGTDEMFERIWQAIDESARTCEDCGAPGRLRGHGGDGSRTLCDACCDKDRDTGRLLRSGLSRHHARLGPRDPSQGPH